MFYCFKISDFIRRNHNLLVLLILPMLLISCDSEDDIPIVQVSSQERLSDAELLQQNSQSRTHAQNDVSSHELNTFYFGFDLRGSPQEDAAQYLPFLTYLENATGYHFKLHFTPKNSSTIEELGKNKCQFAAMGANGFLRAQMEYGAKSLVRGLNDQAKAEYQSVLVVRQDSNITTISDIKGKSFAFGSHDSTQGHLIPRIILTENGISLNDLSHYEYTGSHQNCAEAVVSGKFDVCGMQDKLGMGLALQGMVKIVHTSRYFPSSGIVVNQSVPNEVVAKVRQALIDFEPQGKHSKNLYNWHKTEMVKGFVAANDVDYEDLHHWSIKFGFLPKIHKTEQQ